MKKMEKRITRNSKRLSTTVKASTPATATNCSDHSISPSYNSSCLARGDSSKSPPYDNFAQLLWRGCTTNNTSLRGHRTSGAATTSGKNSTPGRCWSDASICNTVIARTATKCDRSTPGIAMPAPPVPSGAWASTPQTYRQTCTINTNAIPLSAGVSEASAGQMTVDTPALTQQQWAGNASMAGSLTQSTPAGCACPAVMQPAGLLGQMPMTPTAPATLTVSLPGEQQISKNRSSLPKFSIKGGDVTTVARLINEWVQKTAIALNTWLIQAVNFWRAAVNATRLEHTNWFSFTPAQRAARIGLPNTGFLSADSDSCFGSHHEVKVNQLRSLRQCCLAT